MLRTLLLLCLALTAAAQTRVEVIGDNSIVLYQGEEHLNAGSKQKIRIKGNQHIVVLALQDISGLKGQGIARAVLVCRRGDAQISGVSLSTVSAPWSEQGSSALESGVGEDGWGYPGGLFAEMVGGNGNSLVCQAPSELQDGWYRWQVAPDLVYAQVLGLAEGLAIHEWDSDYSRNPTIFAREAGGNAPYLLLELEKLSEPRPDPPRDLRLEPGDPPVLSFSAPESGFAYQIEVGGKELPRWNVPFVVPGSVQRVALRDLSLKPGRRIKVKVFTLNREGKRSRAASVSLDPPDAGKLPRPQPEERAGLELHDPGLVAVPQLDRYDRHDGAVGNLPEGFRANNPVFDGQQVLLSGGAGEVVGFTALLRGAGDCAVQCAVGDLQVELYEALFVSCEGAAKPDPLLPRHRVQLDPEQALPLCVDISIPFDAEPGYVEGALELEDGRRLPIRLQVRDYTLPREASFLCELNSYGWPDAVETFYALQRVAYQHRSHCNLLYYSHSSTAPKARKARLDMLKADGTRMDEDAFNAIEAGDRQGHWQEFAEVFGPYLSGACFADGHRGPVPAPGFYLPFHESWPLKVRAFWNQDLDAYQGFDAEYADTFVAVLADFLQHAEAEGWTRTGFQVYCNNKGSPGDRNKSPWILDEPTGYWDYRALDFYAGLVRRARVGHEAVPLQFRIDISRPQFTRGTLWQAADLWVVQTRAAERYRRLVDDRRLLTGEEIWHYGSSNPIERSNRDTQAWIIAAYLSGAHGVVPWQTINRDGSALQTADPLGLLILTDQVPGGVAHSLRLKAYRRGQQDVEILELLRVQQGWQLSTLRAFVAQYLDLASTAVASSEADAGAQRYERLLPNDFARLREAAVLLLEED